MDVVPVADPTEAALQAKLEAELGVDTEEGTPINAIEETPPVDPPAPEPPPVDPATPPPATEEEEELEAPAPGEEDKPKQIRLKGEDLHFARMLKAGTPRRAAYLAAYGEEPDAAPPQDTPPPAPEPSAEEKRIAEIDERLSAMARDGNVYDEDVDSLNRERTKLTAKVEVKNALAADRAERTKEAEAARAADEKGTAFDQNWAASQTKVVAAYGDAAKDGGALDEAIAARILEISEDPKHRFHTTAKEGNLLPEDVMDEVAAKLQLKPISANGARETHVPKPNGLPVPGSARQTPVPPSNPAQQRAELTKRLNETVDPAEKARLVAASIDDEDDEGQTVTRRFSLAGA